MNRHNTNISHLHLRKIIGLLGLTLPLILAIASGFELQNSISDYYYTKQTTIFTGILTSFGIFLIAYRGYERENEKLSDNAITNIAGILALLTVLIPCSNEELWANMPNGHHNTTINLIHTICAGGFLSLMGWMAYFRFTKGNIENPLKKKRNILYKFCAVGVWISVSFMALLIINGEYRFKYDIFIGECFALFFYGTAWMVKGRALRKYLYEPSSN